jgi:hypothetical protein
MNGQLALWDLDEWTPELKAEAIAIMEAWIVRHGGTL